MAPVSINRRNALRCRGVIRAVIPKSIERDLRVLGDEQVPGVQVAVEDAVDDGALGEAAHADAEDLVGVDARRGPSTRGPRTRIRAAAPSPALGASRVRGGGGRSGSRAGRGGRTCRATSNMFSASRRKSSSSVIVSANSSTRAGGLASAAIGMRPTRNGASHDMTLRSSNTFVRIPGRWTLTTTSSPVIRWAAWTCAIEAAARGTSENQENTSSRGFPRSSSTTRRTESNDSAGTWSRHNLNSLTSSAGNRPSPLEMIWPSLM